MCGTVQMFKIKRILTTYKGFHVFLARNICTGQSTFLALFIIKFEDITQLWVIARVTETAERIAVPKHTVVFIRHDEGYRHLCIVLEQFLILTFIVELIRLVLAQAIESLIIACRLEYLTYCISFRTFHFHRSKGPPVRVFSQNLLAVGIREAYLTRCLRHNGT